MIVFAEVRVYIKNSSKLTSKFTEGFSEAGLLDLSKSVTRFPFQDVLIMEKKDS